MAREKTMDQEEQLIYTKYEKARMIGSRALQLSMGAPFLVKLSQEELKKLHFDPIEIALREYEEGILPITVKRPKAKAN
ncbi:DNA-directed RNA polymerase subunit K [Candidatus Woesearchaeota archaeon]|nr:DNA-directed RNA polymerase subunit K [Candidatus Woesearchaeota archaeon]MBI2581498.1 DNA-directed RNA polymerase subunit K [Candidatus Woesearchaeota archaeon]